MENLIALKQLNAIDSKGREVKVTLGVGAPYRDDNMWRCRAYLSGISNIDTEVMSDESWQSLILALKLLKQLLTYFEEDGGTFYWAESNVKTNVNEVFSNFDI